MSAGAGAGASTPKADRPWSLQGYLIRKQALAYDRLTCKRTLALD